MKREEKQIQEGESKERVENSFLGRTVCTAASAPPAFYRIWFSLFVLCQVPLVHFVELVYFVP